MGPKKKQPLKKGRRKVYSEKELCTRRYHGDVRHLKKWCEEHGMILKHYDVAEPEDVCVLSRNEYHLHEQRSAVCENEEDYFLSIEDYERWCEEGE